MSVWLAQLVPWVVSFASSGVLLAIINGLFTRKKTRAETESTSASATKLITDAAAGVVSNLNLDNATLREEIKGLRARVSFLERWQDAAEHNFELHERWDTRVATELRQLDRSRPVANPPPLRPDISS